MPSREINLLPEETYLEKAKIKHQQKSIFRLTFASVFFTSCLILSVFAYSYYLTSQATSVKKKVEIERQKINRMKNREILLLWTKTKVLAIQKILSGRPLYDSQLKSLDAISSLLTESSFLTNYSFSAKEISFSVEASSSAEVTDFVKKLMEKNESEALFKSIQIDSVNWRSEGNYKLLFSAELTE